MVRLFFWGGTTGGVGILLLLAATSAAVVRFFHGAPDGETLWRRLIAPGRVRGAADRDGRGCASTTTTCCSTSRPGRWRPRSCPGCSALRRLIGIAWALVLKTHQPAAYAAIGLGSAAGWPTARHRLARPPPADVSAADGAPVSPLHEIVPAQARRRDVLSQLIALSFHYLAPSAWLIPDTDERAPLLPGYFRLIVADALARGHVYTTPEPDARRPVVPRRRGRHSRTGRLRQRGWRRATGPWVRSVQDLRQAAGRASPRPGSARPPRDPRRPSHQPAPRHRQRAAGRTPRTPGPGRPAGARPTWRPATPRPGSLPRPRLRRPRRPDPAARPGRHVPDAATRALADA